MGDPRGLGRVAEYYSNVFEADPGYVGVLSHNPMARAHGRGFDTNWRRTEPYRLPELAEVIPFGWRIPKIPRTAEGRKTGLFLAVMQFAGKPEHAEHDLLAVTIATLSFIYGRERLYSENHIMPDRALTVSKMRDSGCLPNLCGFKYCQEFWACSVA